MLPFSQAVSQDLQWVQPDFAQRRFELCAGDRVFAELSFQSAWGSLAVASTLAERWSFKRVGFFNPRVTVRKENQSEDLAVYRPRWTGSEGLLEFPGGASYHWKVANFWATQYAFLGEGDTPLVFFRQGVEGAKLSDVLKTQARVEISPGASALPDLPLLVLLGWYLVILQQEDSAGAAAAAAAAS